MAPVQESLGYTLNFYHSFLLHSLVLKGYCNTLHLLGFAEKPARAWKLTIYTFQVQRIWLQYSKDSNHCIDQMAFWCFKIDGEYEHMS